MDEDDSPTRAHHAIGEVEAVAAFEVLNGRGVGGGCHAAIVHERGGW